MTTRRSPAPGGYEDLLGSTALAHVASINPRGGPQSNPLWRVEKGPTGVMPEKYPNQRPSDERAVVFVRPQHTAQKDG